MQVLNLRLAFALVIFACILAFHSAELISAAPGRSLLYGFASARA